MLSALPWKRPNRTRAGILKSLKKVKKVEISGKLFPHSEVKYPKQEIPN